MQNFFRLIYLNLVLLPNSAFLPKVIKLGLGCLRVEIPVSFSSLQFCGGEQMARFIPTEAFECVFRWDRHKASDEQVFVLATAL